MRIEPSTLQFLKELSKHNNRDWFNKRKGEYLAAQENMINFLDTLIQEMVRHDVLENENAKKSLFRIYSDVRFKKDKSPYNPRFAFRFQRATKSRRGGYYGHIKPGESFIACGFFQPNPEDLLRIRQDIAGNHKEWRKLLKSKEVRKNFEGLEGEKVASAPRGFDKNHPAIDLLRYKSFYFVHNFTVKEIVSPNFYKEVNRIFKSIRSFFDYMSEVLTTDINGESILK